MEPGPSERGRHPPGDCSATLGAFDRLGGDGGRDVVGVVLGLRLEGEEAAQVAFDLCAVGAGQAEEDEHLVVVLARGALAESGAAHGVGGVDARVDG